MTPKVNLGAKRWSFSRTLARGGSGKFGKGLTMDNGFNRRDFIKAVGFGAGMGALAVSSSCQVEAGFRKPAAGMSFQPGKTLRVQPALVYQFHQRREATSWRPWGGLHNQNDVDNEAKRIEQELEEDVGEVRLSDNGSAGGAGE